MKIPFERYREEIAGFPLLTKEEEREIDDIISRNGAGKDKAICRLIKANMRRVLKAARRIAQSRADRGWPVDDFEDLLSAGMEGLTVAAWRYDPDKGAFPTYSWSYIKKYFNVYLDHMEPSDLLMSLDDSDADGRTLEERTASEGDTDHGELNDVRMRLELMLTSDEMELLRDWYGIGRLRVPSEMLARRHHVSRQMISRMKNDIFNKIQHDEMSGEIQMYLRMII